MNLLILLIAIAAIIWALVIYRKLSITTSLWLLIAVGICFGHAFFHRSIGPLPITLDRLLFGIIAAHFAVACLLGRVPEIRWSRIDLVMGAFLLAFVVNLGLTNYGYAGMQPVATFLFFIQLPCMSYMVARTVSIESTRHRWIVGGAIAMGTYLSLTALAEAKGIHGIVFPRHIINSEQSEFFGRGRGPLLNPVANGIVMLGCMAMGLSVWNRTNRVGKYLLASFVMIILLGCYATLTRTVWISAAFSLMLILGLHLSPRRRVVLGAASLLGVGLLLIGTWEYIKSFKRDKDVSVEQMAQSAELRPMLALVASRMAADAPVFGHGFGQYRESSLDYHFEGNTSIPVQTVLPYVQHNVFLSVLVDLGIIGLALFVGLMIGFVTMGIRLFFHRDSNEWKRSYAMTLLVVISAYLINGQFHDVLIMPMVNMILFTVGGFTTNLALSCQPSPEKSNSPTAISPPARQCVST